MSAIYRSDESPSYFPEKTASDADSKERKESLRSMMSRTYEPIRPLAAPDNGAAYYVDAMASIGAPRVDYGLDYWPSRSYWLIPM